MQSPGPLLFRQRRTGMDGKDFWCLKFRSMHVNADSDRVQATKDDPRKFPFGNFMRKTNIDELPQFWNVLRGDMSIVGPRPHMLAHTEQYSALIGKYMVRHFVKPGITGWAQVTGFRGETSELWQMEGRVERDIYYIQHWSIWFDLRIIWMTIKTCFKIDKNAF
jgi:putative colanic acid biosynthesis UDP-glucose lipid carrier transferase